MSWQLLIVAHNVFSAVFVVLQRRLALDFKGKYNLQVVALVHVLISIIGITWAILAKEPINLQKNFEFLHLYILAGLLVFVSSVAHYVMYRYLDAAIGTIVNLMSSFFIVFFSSIILGETLTGNDFLGAGLLGLAVAVIFSSRQKKKIKSSWLKGASHAVVGAVAIGIAITIEKYLVDRVGAVSYVPFGFGIQSMILLIFSARSMPKFLKSAKKVDLKYLVFTGIFRGLAGLCFLLSLSRSGNAAIVGSLTTIKVVLVSILGIVILKEKKLLFRKSLAAFVALIGVMIILA